MVDLRAKFRMLAIALVLLGLGTPQVSACAIGHAVNIFFDPVPKDIDGFVVLEATLVEPQTLADKTGTWMFMGVARIDKVINGEIDGKTVKLFRHMHPCDMNSSEGRHGIVVGTLRKGTRNELEVLTEFQWNTRAQGLREQKERRGQE
jgi:hypothetical protein